MPGLVLGAVGVMVGAATGRHAAMARSPRKCASRRLGVRLLIQLVGVAAFAAAGLGSFYLNGSYTHTDKETGRKTTMAGPEALRAGWENAKLFSRDLSAGLSMLWEREKSKSWREIWEELRAAFKDPTAEAAELLGVAAEAPAEEVKRAHRQLARLHHPDKVEPAKQEEAKIFMQRINWAKEVMLSPAGSRHGLSESFDG